MTHMAENTLPSFDRPPVVETVLGVGFTDLSSWQTPHFGLFWQRIRKDFDTFKVQPPLLIAQESFEPTPQKSQGLRVELSNEPDCPRCWFLSNDSSSLIQVQRDGFLFNWRKTEPEAEYPRYDQYVRPGFERYWREFNEFLQQERIDAPVVIQCEVTYVNHIPRGDGWKSLADWPKVFPILASEASAKFLPTPESGRFNFNYLFPDRTGRLRISIHQAVREIDGEVVLVLQLTARGRPASSAIQDIAAWFDKGREWIVRGFADITSEQMHAIWRRRA